jgi:hypothetical protein
MRARKDRKNDSTARNAVAVATPCAAAYCGECGEPLTDVGGHCPQCGVPVARAIGWGGAAPDETVASGVAVRGMTWQLDLGERQVASERAARARRRVVTVPRVGVVLTGAVAIVLLALAAVTALGADDRRPPDDTKGSAQVVPVDAGPAPPAPTTVRPVTTEPATAVTTTAPPTTTTPTTTTAPTTTVPPSTTVPQTTATTAPAPEPTRPPPGPKPGPPTTTTATTTPPSTTTPPAPPTSSPTG